MLRFEPPPSYPSQTKLATSMLLCTKPHIENLSAPPESIPKVSLVGPLLCLSPITVEDVPHVFQASQNTDMKYMPYGPFDSQDSYRRFLEDRIWKDDSAQLYIIRKNQGRKDEVLGVLGYLQYRPEQYVIELGTLSCLLAFYMLLFINESTFVGHIWICKHAQGKGTISL
jgi:RimJ/RimL family protein N-acetyltransferase